MDNINYIQNYLNNSLEVKKKMIGSVELLEKISTASNKIIDAYGNDRKVLLAGNGGSAADAQHIAAELVSRFFFDRPGLPAIALTTDTSMLTAIGNDYGFDNLFSRQVQAQGQAGDIFIGISTSGNSKNIIEAVKMAKGQGIFTIVFCGEDGALGSMADIAISVPSSCTPHIQECHICIGHVICGIVEEVIFNKPT